MGRRFTRTVGLVFPHAGDTGTARRPECISRPSWRVVNEGQKPAAALSLVEAKRNRQTNVCASLQEGLGAEEGCVDAEVAGQVETSSG
jgi:hypothetical protein